MIEVQKDYFGRARLFDTMLKITSIGTIVNMIRNERNTISDVKEDLCGRD